MAEKKGEVLTQLAIISDLLENANMVSGNIGVIFEVDSGEFNRLFDLISKKSNIQLNKVDDTFTVKIGQVEFMFTVSTSSA